MTGASLRAAAVRVPASTSNLGSGFDALGLAFTLHLCARFEPGHGPLRVTREGTLAALASEDRDDLLARTFARALEDRSAPESGGWLHVTSDIPVARGLGSSAAALVAGWSLARAALALSDDREGAFAAAAREEGHGDNAAPAVWGGLRGVARGPDGFRSFALRLSPTVGFAYAAPAGGVSTRRAREALPLSVRHPVAAAGLGRIAALLAGLADADPELVAIGVEDELHVPYRMPLIPGAVEAAAAGRAAGAWGTTISGSGSGIVALCAPDRADVVAEAMGDAFGGSAAGAVWRPLLPDLDGTKVERVP